MAHYKLHTFRPGETIDAVIKLLGRHDLTAAEMIPLREQFNVLNEGRVPYQNVEFKIPLPSMPKIVNDQGSVENA